MDLARTLERLASLGAAGFYRGEVAQKLVAGVKAAGGIWSMQDLAQYKVIERTPIKGTYRGATITSAAPPSSGGIALMTMLNILSGYELDKLETGQQKHLIVEAMRRTYHDRARYLGDPDYFEIPVTRLISTVYAAGLRAGIHPSKATPSTSLVPKLEPRPKGTDTTHYSIVDREGNRVAATLSVNYPFGSGFMPPGTGVLLNNEMDDFSAKPGVPNLYGLVGGRANAIAPGKRMLSSMSPTFIENDKRIGVIGTPGGSRIITMVLHGILGFVAGEDAATIVSKPRYHHQYLPDEIQFEPGALGLEEQRVLQALGHRLQPLDNTYGNMQVVIIEKDGNTTAASDPRGTGSATVQ
ncbi:MAG: hypothetical protein BMS9Abin15_0812 [Gammaproteobacteria bacterium]|nr:MAG: hypothetical protein BMS9Abin15_0812 [Gammaproteobacteria bacterium]